jgi:hypothetical protein
VTLAVTDGTLTLHGTAGLHFSAGDGYADRLMTFTGTIPAINAALDGMVFTARKKFTTVTLTITTNDLGNSGSGGALSDKDTVMIAVGAGLGRQMGRSPARSNTVAIAVGMATSERGAGPPQLGSAGAPGGVIPSEGRTLADVRPGVPRKPSRTASIDALFAAFPVDRPASYWW